MKLDQLEVQRILFGFFPTYRDSPLQPPAARVLQIGDASGVQSPLSFGGFGAMTRHLARLTASVNEALQVSLPELDVFKHPCSLCHELAMQAACKAPSPLAALGPSPGISQGSQPACMRPCR